MSNLLKIIAMSHGVQSCRVGYKAEYIIARCESAAKACGAYDNPVDVALRFAELYGSAIINYETDEAMARCVSDSASKLDLEWYKMFSDMIPVESVSGLVDEEETDKVLKLMMFDEVKAENDELKATLKKTQAELADLVLRSHGITDVQVGKSEGISEAKVALESTEPQNPPSELSDAATIEPTVSSEAKPVDLSQVPIAVLGVTKALKTALLALGCQTVADVVRRHAEKPLETEPGIGEKSQQMILEAIAKLG